MTISIRPYAPADRDAINRIGVAAFSQYASDYDDWPAFRSRIASMADLAATSDLFVAEREGAIVGGIVHVGPGGARQPVFPDEWSLIRMLVVDPAARSQGIGSRLVAACLQRAQAAGGPAVGLHTSPVMRHALALYTRIGFGHDGDLPPIFGVPYARYVLPQAAIAQALARLGR